MLQRVMMLTLPLLLSGCLSLDPHYQRPAAPVPANLPQGEAAGKQALSYPDVA
ncbi:transporter, partial [Serratia marcescens]